MSQVKTLTIPTHQAAPELLNDWARTILDDQRTKADELFILARLFEYSVEGNLALTYPLIIELSEKPDFVFRSGARTIGVEVTKFQAEQRGRLDSILNDQHDADRRQGITPSAPRPMAIYTTTPFDFDSRKRKTPEIVERMIPSQVGLTDWVSIPERVKVHSKKFCEIIEDKSRKVKDHGLGPTAELWLLVEDRMQLSKFSVSDIGPRVEEFILSSAKQIPFRTILFSLIMDEKVVSFTNNR